MMADSSTVRREDQECRLQTPARERELRKRGRGKRENVLREKGKRERFWDLGFPNLGEFFGFLFNPD